MRNFLVPILTLTFSIGAIVFSLLTFFYNNSENYYDSDFQAVFLSNGQVYFGTIESSTKNYLVLNNAHYIQLDSEQNQTASTEIKLIKVGGEIHSPKSKLFINQANVLLIQELKSPSQMVQKLKESI